VLHDKPCKLRALTAFDGFLYGATADHKLVRREIQGTGWVLVRLLRASGEVWLAHACPLSS
jgi:hypothetical protein